MKEEGPHESVLILAKSRILRHCHGLLTNLLINDWTYKFLINGMTNVGGNPEILIVIVIVPYDFFLAFLINGLVVALRHGLYSSRFVI